MVFVDTAKYAATSLTLSSVRNLSAESSVNDAKTCDCLESKPAASRVVASGCEALLLPGQASSGLRSRGPQVRLLPGAPNPCLGVLAPFWSIDLPFAPIASSRSTGAAKPGCRGPRGLLRRLGLRGLAGGGHHAEPIDLRVAIAPPRRVLSRS